VLASIRALLALFLSLSLRRAAEVDSPLWLYLSGETCLICSNFNLFAADSYVIDLKFTMCLALLHGIKPASEARQALSNFKLLTPCFHN
jgi:hypothetical protein